MKAWTKEDLNLLTRYYIAGHRLKAIGHLLGEKRSPAALSQAVMRLNIRREKRPSLKRPSWSRRSVAIPIHQQQFSKIRPLPPDTIQELNLRYKKVDVGKKPDHNWVKLDTAIHWLRNQNIPVEELMTNVGEPTGERSRSIHYRVGQKILTPQQLVILINKRREDLRYKRFLIHNITW